MSVDRDAYLDQVLVGGREPVVIEVVDYDDAWPRRYRATAQRITGALGASALRVEHIGSTSVPGLAAKPIVDILLVVECIADEPAYLPALESAGLTLRVRERDHRMLRSPERDVHLHVYEHGRAEIRDYLDLRDWLLVDMHDRELYAATKRRLARQRWADMNEYADAKTEVVHDILTRARRWRRRTDDPEEST